LAECVFECGWRVWIHDGWILSVPKGGVEGCDCGDGGELGVFDGEFDSMVGCYGGLVKIELNKTGNEQ
jgi:hypothetical protein